MSVIKIVPFPGVPGPNGAQGASAYDIAVENGFEGTEQEWLDSLGSNADIADFVFDTVSDDNTESRMTVSNHDMLIRTTRDDGQDADIELNSADDIWINAYDQIELTAENDNIDITALDASVYITAGGYRGEAGETWEFQEDGGLTFPDGTTQTTAYTGGADAHGNFVFDNNTLSVDNETVYFKATDAGDDSVQLIMNPYDGIAKLSATGGQSTPRYYAEGEWDSATWTTLGEGYAEVSFTNAPNIVDLVNNTLTNASNVGIFVNGATIGAWNGASTNGNNITIYVGGPNAENIENANVTEFGFNYAFESKIEIDNDENEINIVGRGLDINISTTGNRDIRISSSDDLTLESGDDTSIRSAGYINFVASANSNDYEWRMESNGTLEFPARGRLRNPANSSGDGNGYDTFHIIPDFGRYDQDQYIIVDPTQPNHIHIRAGGAQDYSNAELILGGERVHVKVADSSGNVEIQAKKEDLSWTYQNIDPAGGVVFVVDTELAEPDLGDFMVVDGAKYVISSVVRNEEFGLTSYETTPSFTFNYNEYYTFKRDMGEWSWRFDEGGYISGPNEGGILVYDIERNDGGDLFVTASEGGRIVLDGTSGEYLNSPNDPNNQIATIGDLGAGANGQAVRFSPNFQATGLVFTGSGATYPTFNSYYVKNGRMASFWIEIDLSTVTNFGTGQYITALPFEPLPGAMNHFQAWVNVDPAVNPDLGGHVVLQADHLANTTALDLHYLKQAGGANSALMEAMFKQGTPATLTTDSKIYINGTYITAE
jgi:hypothetical protein